MGSAKRIENEAALQLSKDARVVAVRWDLVEWGLVLDLDTPISEAEGAPMRRAWLVFPGVAECTMPILAARLPNGIWLSSALRLQRDGQGFQTFRCDALLPVFEGEALQAAAASQEFSVRAQGFVGLASETTERPTQYGLSLDARRRLCSDEELLHATATALR